MITIKDVAEKAGVSPSTVSTIINRRHKQLGICDDTRRKVIKTMREMNYVPNFYSQNLRRGKTMTIGMIASDISNFSVALVTDGAESEASEHEYHIILGISSNSAERERFFVKNFLSRRVDGLIVSPAPSGETLDDLERPAMRGFPLVVFSDRPGIKIDTISGDEEAGSHRAVNYLHELGHRRIAYVSAFLGWPNARRKLRGYTDTLQDLGIEPLDELHIRVEKSTLTDGRKAAEIILRMDTRPDAVIFHSDAMAAGALNVLMDAGVRIPRDMSAIAFGSEFIAEVARVPMTTITAPYVESGRAAVRMILERIQQRKKQDADPQEFIPKSVRFAPKLVIRASTAPRNK